MPGHKRKSMGDDDMQAIAKMEKGGIVKMMKGGRVGYKEGGLVHDLQKLEGGGKIFKPDSNKKGKGKILKPDSNKKGKGKILKPVPEENKGLSKLPKKVRNRMGFMKKGGIV